MTTCDIRRLTLCTSALLILAAADISWGQDPGPSGLGTIDSAIKNDKSDFLVRSEVNHFSREYQDGDSLSVRVISEADAYLYVFYQQTDGKTFLIFPNGIETRNRVRARHWVAIPSEDDLFRWRMGSPFGKELIKVVASRKPIEALTARAPGAGRFDLVHPKQVQDAAKDLSKQASRDWAEQSTPIVTAAARPGGPARTGRRFGLIIGVPTYKYDDMIEQACKVLEIPAERQDLPSCKNDVTIMDLAFQKLGRLNDQRVLVGEDATRAAIEEAITKWLPAVSSPGDTVFIYHSGHGGQIPDDDGDEAQTDKLDEFLMPHDFAGPDALKAAMVLNKVDLVRSLLLLAEAGPAPDGREAQQSWLEKASDKLARKTGITDDQFGHWLQALDGRQVVVILDICHAGGFATREKGLPRKSPEAEFNFLDRELSRLKDIGQRNVALLSACRTGESSQAQVVISKDKKRMFSVLTYFLIVQFENSRGPLELSVAYDGCRTAMKEYFASREYQAAAKDQKPPLKPHEPVLYSDLAHPAFLRP